MDSRRVSDARAQSKLLARKIGDVVRRTAAIRADLAKQYERLGRNSSEGPAEHYRARAQELREKSGQAERFAEHEDQEASRLD
jgi:hypothetical protein